MWTTTAWTPHAVRCYRWQRTPARVIACSSLSPAASTPTCPIKLTSAPRLAAAAALLAPPPPMVSWIAATEVSPSSNRCAPARNGAVLKSRLMFPTTQSFAVLKIASFNICAFRKPSLALHLPRACPGLAPRCAFLLRQRQVNRLRRPDQRDQPDEVSQAKPQGRHAETRQLVAAVQAHRQSRQQNRSKRRDVAPHVVTKAGAGGAQA